MAEKPRRLVGPAAVSVLAAASLAGAPAASADEVCLQCPDRSTGLALAFEKLADKAFPGVTFDVLLSKAGTETAFAKLAEKGFPGLTADVFFKQ